MTVGGFAKDQDQVGGKIWGSRRKPGSFPGRANELDSTPNNKPGSLVAWASWKVQWEEHLIDDKPMALVR